MSVYENRDAYRIVPHEGGVQVLSPGGFASTAFEGLYADVAAARAAIARAIRDGLPAAEVVDEATTPTGAPT